MDSYNKASVIHSGVWGTVVLVILIVSILSVSSCMKEQENKVTSLKSECIQKGNSVIPTSSQYQFICIKTVEEKK